MIAGAQIQQASWKNPESTSRNFVNETKTVENRDDENLDQSSDVCIVSLFVEQLSVAFWTHRTYPNVSRLQ